MSFGSDGTPARPAEHTAGGEITLQAGVTAYAGVNPKTTAGDGGKEPNSIVASVGDDDPDPVTLRVGTITVTSRSSRTGTPPPTTQCPSPPDQRQISS